VRSAMKPVWDGSEFVPRLMLPLSLSYDHRVIDGAAAARFVKYLVNILEDMRRVLLRSRSRSLILVISPMSRSSRCSSPRATRWRPRTR
jgi:hypothetical protein